MQMLLEADSHPTAANRVVFVAGLSGCVSMLHHIGGHRGRGGGVGGRGTLCLMLGYMAAHHRPAGLVVQGP